MFFSWPLIWLVKKIELDK
uniref:Uncharacterized protein n=1 Tax=Arundo donax TaxID=35708 RepID=A0A0A8ZIU6_ARUDO